MTQSNGVKPVKISAALHAKIEAEAKAKKRTMRAHVEDILDRYLARKAAK